MSNFGRGLGDYQNPFNPFRPSTGNAGAANSRQPMFLSGNLSKVLKSKEEAIADYAKYPRPKGIPPDVHLPCNLIAELCPPYLGRNFILDCFHIGFNAPLPVTHLDPIQTMMNENATARGCQPQYIVAERPKIKAKITIKEASDDEESEEESDESEEESEEESEDESHSKKASMAIVRTPQTLQSNIAKSRHDSTYPHVPLGQIPFHAHGSRSALGPTPITNPFGDQRDYLIVHNPDCNSPHPDELVYRHAFGSRPGLLPTAVMTGEKKVMKRTVIEKETTITHKVEKGSSSKGSNKTKSDDKKDKTGSSKKVARDKKAKWIEAKEVKNDKGKEKEKDKGKAKEREKEKKRK